MDDNGCKDWSILIDKAGGDGHDGHDRAGDPPPELPARVEYAEAVLEPHAYYSLPRTTVAHEGTDAHPADAEEPFFFKSCACTTPCPDPMPWTPICGKTTPFSMQV